MARVTMNVVSDELDAVELQSLTFNLCATLNDEGDVDAEVAEAGGGAGAKGGEVSLGTIILTLIGSGGVVVTLVNVLKSYIERGRHLEIELERGDGKKIKVKADNVGDDEIEQTRKLVREFLRD